MKTIKYTLLLPIAIFMIACAPKAAMIKVDTLVAKGHYSQAGELSEKNLNKRDEFAKDNLLWRLFSGSAYLQAGENNKSIESFDEGEALMSHYKEQILAKDIAQTLSSILVNDTTRPYIGTEYDGIMLNTYKAIDYMSKNDMSGARVEFNRAIDRQRRAKIFFAKMIEKEKQAIDKKEQESAQEGKNLKVDDETIDSKLLQEYPSLHAFKPYPDFVNPMSTYLAGIFAYADGDSSKSQYLLKEAYGMMPKNEDVRADFEEKMYDETVWLIFENGQAPILKEWRIDFPIWIFTSNLSYISIALPKLIERDLAFTHLDIHLENNETIKTQFLSSMDRVIKTEFEKSYRATVRRAILSAATKTALNYTIQNNSNNSNAALFVEFAAAVYQIASTQADTRIWSTLPKEFDLARFKRPKDGLVRITSPNNMLVKTLNLPKSKHTLIYVKMATPYAQASVRVISF